MTSSTSGSCEAPGAPRIHPAERALAWGGHAAAFFYTGADKVRSGYGNGDCLLLDFGRRLFCAADATERLPLSSRELLLDLAERTGGEEGPLRAPELAAHLGAAYATRDFRRRSTLCCVALEGLRDGGASLALASGGDSTVTVLDRRAGTVLFRSEPDMLFAGRSTVAPAVSALTVAGGEYRVVLATDGLNDCMRDAAAGQVPREWYGLDCDGLSARLRGDLECAGHDDAAAVIIDLPGALSLRWRGVVVMGGTGAAEEARFRAKAAAGGEMGPGDAGITILGGAGPAGGQN